MVFKIGKLLEKGKLKGKGVVDLFHDHEKRIDDLESSGGSGYDDTEIKARITTVENGKVDKEVGKSLVWDTDIAQITTNKNDIINIEDALNEDSVQITTNKNDIIDIKDAIGDESDPDSIIGRIKSLEDAP